MARPKSPEKKEWIRKAAIRIISDEGFHKCTTDKIAEQAGVSVGTIYNYFQDKEDILSYIFQVEHTKLNIYFDRIMKKEMTVPDKFKLLISKYFKYAFNNKKLVKLIHDESNRPAKRVTQEMFSYMLAIREHLKELLKKGVEEGSIYSDYDLDIIANILLGSANVTALFGHLKPEKIDYISTEGPEILFNVLANGIFKISNK